MEVRKNMETSIPLYSREWEAITEKNLHKEFLRENNSYCWNCGSSSHILSSCSFPQNRQTIAHHKQIFEENIESKKRRPTRYYDPQREVGTPKKTGTNYESQFPPHLLQNHNFGPHSFQFRPLVTVPPPFLFPFPLPQSPTSSPPYHFNRHQFRTQYINPPPFAHPLPPFTDPPPPPPSDL